VDRLGGRAIARFGDARLHLEEVERQGEAWRSPSNARLDPGQAPAAARSIAAATTT